MRCDLVKPIEYGVLDSIIGSTLFASVNLLLKENQSAVSSELIKTVASVNFVQ